MLLPDGTVLMHDGTPYDAAKAHEYYMRTRKLHPRAVAGRFTVPPPPPPHHPAKAQPMHGPSYVVKTGHGSVRLTPKQYAAQKAYAAHRVTQIKAKLHKLNAELRKKLAEAEVRSQNANKPATAAEKAATARKSKEYRKEHKQELATKQHNRQPAAKAAAKAPAKKTATVASIRAEIIVMRDNLKSAVAKQRQLATAKKNG